MCNNAIVFSDLNAFLESYFLNYHLLFGYSDKNKLNLKIKSLIKQNAYLTILLFRTFFNITNPLKGKIWLFPLLMMLHWLIPIFLAMKLL
jgi:hypothetical protein